jgi:anti-sigma B factor antagonist
MTLMPDADLPSSSAELLQWSTASSERETVISLCGEIDLSTTGMLHRALKAAMHEQPAQLAVDVTQVSFLDSTGIGCLLDAAREGAEMGCKLVVRNPTAAITRVFEICGVDKILLEDADPKSARRFAS